MMVAACSSTQPVATSDATADATPDSDTAPGTDCATTETPRTDAADTSQCEATGTATVTGTLAGASLAAQDAIFTTEDTATGAAIVIEDVAAICANGDNVKANSRQLVFNLSAGALAVGTIAVGNNLQVQYTAFDSVCGQSSAEASTAGSVVITAISACEIDGTFDVTLGTDHVTGSFHAAACTLPTTGGACL
jgi:hypothetical protein